MRFKFAVSRRRLCVKCAGRQIIKRGSYEAITPVAKAKWTKLLSHNEWDCRGTRHVLLRAIPIR